jgi:phosphatidylglycerophosphate synthase
MPFHKGDPRRKTFFNRGGIFNPVPGAVDYHVPHIGKFRDNGNNGGSYPGSKGFQHMKNRHLVILPFSGILLNMYTMRDIIASLPPEKARQDGLWTRFVLRPLSFPVSWAALNMGLRPAGVSYLSALVSIAGGILFAWPRYPLAGAGVILLNVFSVLDCVDGNMARASGRAGPWGGWADAVTGFIAYTAVFFSSGIYLFWKTLWWPVLVVTGLTSSANLLTRTAYQIYKNIVGESAHGSVSFERLLAENAGITGFLMPLLLVFHFCGFMPGIWFIIWFNAVFYGGGCVFTIIKLAGKAAR